MQKLLMVFLFKRRIVLKKRGGLFSPHGQRFTCNFAKLFTQLRPGSTSLTLLYLRIILCFILSSVKLVHSRTITGVPFHLTRKKVRDQVDCFFILL